MLFQTFQTLYTHPAFTSCTKFRGEKFVAFFVKRAITPNVPDGSKHQKCEKIFSKVHPREQVSRMTFYVETLFLKSSLNHAGFENKLP